MSGAEFLTTVERLYPETMRMVISGNTEELAVARCSMYGHRYLPKPHALKPGEDPKTVARRLALAHWKESNSSFNSPLI